MLGHGIVDRIKGETGPRHRHLDTKVSVWERSDRSEKIGDRQMLAATILWARLIQFIMISRASTLSAVENTHIVIGHDSGIVNSSSQTSRYKVEILCRELDWQVSSLEQVCTSCLPLLTTEDLYIQQDPYSSPQPDWQGNIENSLWLELLHPFSTVKNLHLSKEIVPRIAPALQELVGNRTTEVLPTLQNIFLEEVEPAGRVQEDIGRFVAARQLSGHTITVSHWEKDPTGKQGWFY